MFIRYSKISYGPLRLTNTDFTSHGSRTVSQNLAEREGFEPPVELPPHLISSQTPSTVLGHLSYFYS
jgi:hypothetical protein